MGKAFEMENELECGTISQVVQYLAFLTLLKN